MKSYRKTIRIDGQEVKSPRFQRASDAEKWYQQKLREKHFSQEGMSLPLNTHTTLREYFAGSWLPERKKNYPEPTWKADEQRFEKYVDKALGSLRVAKINQLQVRKTLKNVCDAYGASTATRDRVRSLLSKIFNDSMNQETPLRIDNPALNISFDGKREGKKTPNHIRKAQDVLKFIKEAKKLSPLHYAYACIFLMSGVRKSEGIALRWNDFDEDEAELRIDEKFEQATMSIKKGTKAGTEAKRIIPIPDDLVMVLKAYKAKADFQGDEDFILCDEHGECIKPRDLHNIHLDIAKAAGIDVTPHGLRHTYGRQFAVNNGNLKALQAIMGHSNSTTTDLYSELAGKALKKHRNAVSLGLDEIDDE